VIKRKVMMEKKKELKAKKKRRNLIHRAMIEN
jgi:hypothetical protein